MKKFISIIGIFAILASAVLMTGCGAKDQEEKSQINALSDLKGKTVAAQMGSENAVSLSENENAKDANIIYETTIYNGFSDLLAGKIDAFVADNVVAVAEVNKYDNLKILDESLDESPIAFAFHLGNPIQEEFNERIVAYKSDGTVDKLFDKWMNDGAVIDPELSAQKWPGNSGTLTVAIEDDYAPICFRDEDGNLQGFDIEFLLNIARDLDYKIEFKPIAFDRLFSSIASGKYDLAASGLTVNEDRKNIVDFSEDYLNADSVVIVKDFSKEKSTDSILYSIKNSFYRVFIENDRWLDLIGGIGMTILVSMLSMLIGAVLGFVLYLIYNKDWKIFNVVFKKTSHILFLMPGMIWMFIFYYIIYAGNAGNGFQSVIASFSILFGFITAEWLIYSVGLIDEGQKEAAYAMGYTKYQALFKLFIPQAMPEFIEMMEVEVVGMIKMTCLIELVSVMDVQAVADVILNETNVPFLPVLLPGIFYIIFGGLVNSGMVKLREYLLKERSEQDIRKRLLKGKL